MIFLHDKKSNLKDEYEDGNINNIVANTNFGYGMEKEVIRIIKKGPKWTPAR